VPRDTARGRILTWALQTSLALLLGAAVYFVWPRLDLPRLGREEYWFSLGWLIILAAPAAWRLLGRPGEHYEPPQTIQADVCGHASFFSAALFVGLLMFAPSLGNYKLWLGIVYLAGLTLRLAGLTLGLREYLLSHPDRHLVTALGAFAITTLACLLIIPWIRPDLTAVWPPVPEKFFSLVLAGLLWGGISGAVFLGLRLWVRGQRVAWLGYLAVGLGPGPALAVTWFDLVPLAVTFLALAGFAILSALHAKTKMAAGMDGPYPITLYWLLRAMMLLWWGCGAALALAAAWWQPHLDSLFAQSIWLRALGLGGFLVVCVGVLAEYSLPLLGWTGSGNAGRERKPLGVILSALALLAAFIPLLFTDPPQKQRLPQEFAERARAELLASPVVLDAANPEIILKAPTWLNRVSHIFVVSHLSQGTAVPQGTAVAQVVATDDMDLPYIFNLTAGIDTAEADLDRRATAVLAKHQAARHERTWTVYTATGEAYNAHSFFAGLFLGRAINQLKSLRLRYLPQKNWKGAQPKLTIQRVFVY